jgi:hypothetical protein
LVFLFIELRHPYLLLQAVDLFSPNTMFEQFIEFIVDNSRKASKLLSDCLRLSDDRF